ncbi:hypothetical protein [Neptunomonas phycophila]|uniref:hypothetical protein n=1 Tax=Neptunomonas phycophila TaxID=1572645 RepID=UPI0037370A98
MEKEKILTAAQKFRSAIELLKDELDRPDFEAFPLGACGAASGLLGAYLDELGLGRFHYVCGRTSGQNWISHAWLELDGWILDITADQFDNVDDQVVFGRDLEFYEAFFNIEYGRECTKDSIDELDLYVYRMIVDNV